MGYQNISFTLAPADADAVKLAITTISQKLPFLITLSEDEKKGLVKLGPKSMDFVLDANTAVSSWPTILPATFNKDEFAKDTALFKTLMEIKFLLDSVCEKVDNTLMAVGSEAMTSALEVYSYVQTAQDRTPGLKTVAEKLKDRFRAQGYRKPKGEAKK